MLGAGGALVTPWKLHNRGLGFTTQIQFAKGRTLCPSQRVTLQAALGFIEQNISSPDQHQLNENFAIDQKPFAARNYQGDLISPV